MIRKIALIFCILTTVSCGEKYSPDLLTKGTWIADNGSEPSDKETIEFNTDGTYSYEIPFMDYSKPIQEGSFFYNRPVKLSGNWLMIDDSIQFIHSMVSMPEDTSSNIAAGQYKVNVIWGGIYSGALVQPRFLNVYKNDSKTLEMGIDFPPFLNVFGTASLDSEEINDSWTWKIIKLTEDSLMVSSHKRILKYYR